MTGVSTLLPRNWGVAVAFVIVWALNMRCTQEPDKTMQGGGGRLMPGNAWRKFAANWIDIFISFRG